MEMHYLEVYTHIQRQTTQDLMAVLSSFIQAAVDTTEDIGF